MAHRRVTIEDIARESNASPTTVSLVLRDKPGIGTDTRQRVLAAARALGYQRRGPSRPGPSRDLLNVALVVRARARLKENHVAHVNPFYSWVLMGIEAGGRARAMNLLYATLPVDDHNRPLDFPHHLLDQGLDGVLLVGSFSSEVVAEVIASGSGPVVLVDGPDGIYRCDAIVSDNEGGAYAALAHLISRGHRHIGYVGPSREVDPNFNQRYAGYRRALEDAGLPAYESRVIDYDSGDATIELLRAHPEVSALFGANDAFILPAMRAVVASGRSVPGDLSVIGFDDIEPAAQATPALTTMAVDKVSMGRLAIDALAYRLAWPDSATMLTTLRPRLLERGSVGWRDVGAGTADP